jgi:hypothetical protein
MEAGKGRWHWTMKNWAITRHYAVINRCIAVRLGVLQSGETRRFCTCSVRSPAGGCRWAHPALLQSGEDRFGVIGSGTIWITPGCMQVRTRTPIFDHMINVHNPHQCWITTNGRVPFRSGAWT